MNTSKVLSKHLVVDVKGRLVFSGLLVIELSPILDNDGLPTFVMSKSQK